MDVSFMTDIVSSGTTMLTSLVGALFTFIETVLPLLLGLAALGFVIWGIKWMLSKFRRIR